MRFNLSLVIASSIAPCMGAIQCHPVRGTQHTTCMHDAMVRVT